MKGIIVMLWAALAITAATQGSPMKVYIWTDLEGVGCVLTWNQTGRDEKAEDYRQACKWLTAEVNAAAQAAFDAGATEVIAEDGHSSGFNFVLNDLLPDIKVVSGPGRVEWLPGLDKTVDAVLMIGCHAMAGTPRAILDHTQSSKAWANYWVNNVLMGEIGQAAVFAGAVNVPVVFVSGDRAACEEAKKLLGSVETAAVKEGLSRTSGILLSPVKSRALISEGVKKALSRIKDFKPYKTTFPAEVKIEAQNTDIADAWEKAGWQRLNGRTVKRTARTANEILP